MPNPSEAHNRRKYDKWERDLVEVKSEVSDVRLDVTYLRAKQNMIEKLTWAILLGILGLFIKSLV